MRFDVALMDHLRVELAPDDDVGVGEGCLHIAILEVVVRGDVARLLRLLAVHGLRVAALIQQRRVLAHRVLDVEDGLEDLVLDLDLLDRCEGLVRAYRGNGGDRVAAVERLRACHHVQAHVGGRGRSLAHVDHLVGNHGEVLVGHDPENARHRLRLAGVDGDDAGVRVGTAEDGAVNEVGKVDVGTVERLARDLLNPVGADGPGANDLVVGLLRGGHAETSPISDALRTARTILS